MSQKLRFLSFALIIIFLYFILNKIGFKDILDVWYSLPHTVVISALVLNMLSFLLWAVRWKLLMPRPERKTIFIIFPIFMAGVFRSVLTAGPRVGGEPFMGYLMKRRYGGERTRHIGCLLAAKFFSVVTLIVFGMFSVAFIILFVKIGLKYKLIIWLLVFLPVAVMISGILLRKIFSVLGYLNNLLLKIYNFAPFNFLRKKFPEYKSFESYLIQKIDNLTTPVKEAVVSPKSWAKGVVLSVCGWLSLCTAYYILFHCLGSEIHFIGVIIIVSISEIVGHLSLSPAGIGVIETAVITLSLALGVSSDIAAAVALLARTAFYVCSLGVGGICFLIFSIIYGREKD